MNHNAGTSGVGSVAGMGVAALAVAAVRLKLEATQVATSAIGASLLPPGGDGASIVALTQQQAGISDYLSKLSKGSENLDTLVSAMGSHTAATVTEDFTSSRQIDAV